MSDTPRTDANKFEVATAYQGKFDGRIIVTTVEHSEQLERENNQLRADLKQCAEALKENRITVSHSGAGHVCVGCGEPFQHPHKDYCLINKALSLPAVQNALKGK